MLVGRGAYIRGGLYLGFYGILEGMFMLSINDLGAITG